MQVDILARPAAAAARCHLQPGESLVAEVGSMIAMTAGMNVVTTSRKRGGGLMAGIKRMFAGESMFVNEFTANAPDQRLHLAPALMGDIVHHRLDGGSLVVQGSSWLASSADITIDATWQGFGKALFSGEGAFWLKLAGAGDVLLSSYGAVTPVEVDGEYVVDNGHIVAFEDTLQFRMAKAGTSLVGSFLGGEGLVCRFSGRGRLWCQSHNAPDFGRRLGGRLKPR
jgi:uncharacterized protein (TIGR00266 family)